MSVRVRTWWLLQGLDGRSGLVGSGNGFGPEGHRNWAMSAGTWLDGTARLRFRLLWLSCKVDHFPVDVSVRDAGDVVSVDDGGRCKEHHEKSKAKTPSAGLVEM